MAAAADILALKLLAIDAALKRGAGDSVAWFYVFSTRVQSPILASCVIYEVWGCSEMLCCVLSWCDFRGPFRSCLTVALV